jgi:hypothetical protein
VKKNMTSRSRRKLFSASQALACILNDHDDRDSDQVSSPEDSDTDTDNGK